MRFQGPAHFPLASLGQHLTSPHHTTPSFYSHHPIAHFASRRHQEDPSDRAFSISSSLITIVKELILVSNFRHFHDPSTPQAYP